MKDNQQRVVWSASEYMEHSKDSDWYLRLFAAGLVFSVVVFFATGQEWFATLAVASMFVIFGLSARQQPSPAEYEISPEGLSINGSLRPFSDFASFSLLKEHGVVMIYLTPTNRFQVPRTVYLDNKDAGKIVEIIKTYLPYEDKDPAGVDKALSRIRY